MRILLPIDSSEFSEAAIQTVMAQFEPRGSDVHVFHAVDWERGVRQASAFAQGPAAVQDLLTQRDQMCRHAEALVEQAATRLRSAGFTVSTAIAAEGDPRTAILDTATAWKADLIVVGSHGRTGLDRFLLGSVAEGVVRHARCSVEVVRRPA